jgi:hypothetical protein
MINNPGWCRIIAKTDKAVSDEAAPLLCRGVVDCVQFILHSPYYPDPAPGRKGFADEKTISQSIGKVKKTVIK